jgi:hypothetical protein
MRVTGWLCPSGEFIQCDRWEHIETCRKHPIFAQRVPKVLEILEDLDSTEEMCQELADREGNHNAEWHIYDIARDAARPKIWRLLLNDGFIRVGEVDGDLHFEGRPNQLKSKYQMCKDLADSYGAGAVFEPQR